MKSGSGHCVPSEALGGEGVPDPRYSNFMGNGSGTQRKGDMSSSEEKRLSLFLCDTPCCAHGLSDYRDRRHLNPRPPQPRAQWVSDWQQWRGKVFSNLIDVMRYITTKIPFVTLPAASLHEPCRRPIRELKKADLAMDIP
ncbi:hypothetical protein EYF80_054001 [Liparis tanakae]|uniref:Uncharacterized protein n=1 Tax=Liparis tanakae TaxID=230148 RepID=A0A4Z2F444_9TELE|nr:hypothetical protein EYF80_054001 [Liparis tanakae]